jgi:peptidoglycan/LPS O-acetylase OafA/YrhL
MQSWQFVNTALPAMLNSFLIVLPATIAFAWIFFWFCEKPFLARRARVSSLALSAPPHEQHSIQSPEPVESV